MLCGSLEWARVGARGRAWVRYVCVCVYERVCVRACVSVCVCVNNVRASVC